MWNLQKDCKSLIKNSWNTMVVGCPMYILNSKLKTLKSNLKDWNKASFVNVHEKVKIGGLNLDVVQKNIDSLGHSDTLVEQEIMLYWSWNMLSMLRIFFWKEKSKIKWALEGDITTSYFHKLAKINHSIKRIMALRVEDNIITNQLDIAFHVVNRFTNLFYSSSLLLDNDLIQRVIPNLITDDINHILALMHSAEEIHQVVFALNPSSAPGPDGFGGCFYQTHWDIIKEDVINDVLEFFSTSWLLPNFNSNTLVLVPKVDNADRVDQFRPIALANFKFKIITKIQAYRLGTIMLSLISKEQNKFIHGRLIRDCIAITSEAFNILLNKSINGNLCLKIDMAKAFDTLDWCFLLKVLRQLGFCNTFCDWISTILHSAKIFLYQWFPSWSLFLQKRGQIRSSLVPSSFLHC
ncbi:unnamed protein product [Lathyrus sativus]|nr:unnamed protein product [Lathyrus sativus]